MHGKAIVVRLKSLYALQSIRCIFKDLKLHEGRVLCLGGLMVLIDFSSKDRAVMARDEIVGVPEHFGAPEIWEGQSMVFERIAWLRIYGVPLCLSDNKVVNEVGSLFGKVIKGARVERIGLYNSFQFLGVLVNHGNRIQEEAFIWWRGKTFKVWVVEDGNDWLEDFIVDPVCQDGDRNMEEESSKSPDNSSSRDRPKTVTPVNVINAEEFFSGNCDMDCNVEDHSKVDLEFPILNKEREDNNQGVNSLGLGNGLKRKKVKNMINMGMSSSGGYYSSNERPNKEPKKVGDDGPVFNEDDPFELDPIIFGIDSNVVKTRGEGPVNISNSFQVLMEENDADIHNQNGVTRDADRPFEGLGYRSTDCTEAEVIAEVSGTK
ncbi:hypothetical protein HanPSC8_Chr13g0554281 [Helianthus annuus]|nr:hypothetical protein HanPSC8_Chr13g0554281 [Helianthus annuus]